jgi:hypothetical protein
MRKLCWATDPDELHLDPFQGGSNYVLLKNMAYGSTCNSDSDNSGQW